ncbi:MAG: hypothetical protein HZB26_01430 [Candidatus Hydrogenedentes bacterium]|nr:hypothetical protein [Candidatus Hydrogenedentota bacterium]
MKPSSERFFMVAAGICVMAIAAAIAFQMVTEQKRGAALAKMKKPAILTRQLAANASPANAAKQGEQDGSGATRIAPDKAAESVAAFTSLLPQVGKFGADERWRALYDDVFLKKAPRDWTLDESIAAKSFANEARPLIQEIRRLAELGGPAKELDYSKGAAIELPHLAPLRACARLLMIDAKVQAQSANYGEAVEDILAAWKLGDVIKDEPILISQLVRCAMDGIAYNCIQEALPANGLDPELARHVIEGSRRADAHQSFAEAFSGEGMFGLDTFEQLRDGSTEGLMGGGIPSSQQLLVTVYGSRIARPWLNMDETAYSETMARVQEAAQLPYAQARPLMQQIEQDVENLPRTRILTHILLPSLTQAIGAQARDEAMLALVQVGLALEMYHTQNGTYPASLDSIAAAIGGRVPVDPFTGTPLGYKPSGQSFVLYSVGHDLIDDGGQQGYKPNGQMDYLHGDIVWRAQPRVETEK